MKITAKRASDPLSISHLNSELKSRSARGGVLTVGSQGAQFVIQSVGTVVLARLLTPADFGIVAMVTAVTGLGQAFADMGLSEATIQKDDINHEQVSALFWINLAIGLGLMLITAALAPGLAWFYKEPRLKSIALLVSLTFLISSLRVQHDGLLKRQMRFASLAIRDVGSWAISVPIAICLAWHGFGYWALVALPLMASSFSTLFSWLSAGWIPSFPTRGAKIASLMKFGGNVAASYLVVTLNRSADNALVGWYWGAGPLGLYSRAYNLLMLPVKQVSLPAASVAVPTFSRIQTDPPLFARYYLRAINLIMWITAPLFGLLFVAATSIVAIVLGKQWVQAAPVFQILAISALSQILLESTIWLFVSRGQATRLLRMLLIVSPIIILSYAIGLPFGIKGVALTGSLVMVGMLPWILRFSFKGTDLTLSRVFSAIINPLAVSSFCVLISEAVLGSLKVYQGLPQLIIAMICFATICCMSLMFEPIRAEIMAFRDLLRRSPSITPTTEMSQELEVAS